MIDNKVSKGQVKLDELTDPRDGKKYKIVKIGNQVWMAENINYKPKDGWVFIKSFCYDNNEENCEKYGRYYAREVIVKICPVGWHLPTNAEFEELLYTVGGKKTAGKVLKSKEGWHKDFFVDKNGTDKFGFSVLPSGYRMAGGSSWSEGTCAYFWSATEQSYAKAFALVLCEEESVNQSILEKKNGYSVRCIKDE